MSLHNHLESFRQATEKIEDYGYTESVEIKEELRPNKQSVIKAKIVFIDRSVLHIREYIDKAYEHVFALLNAMEKKADTFCRLSS